MSTLTVGTISEKVTDAGVSVDGVTLKDGELGTTASPVAIHSTSLNGGQFGGRRNLIINGAMQFDARNGGSSYAQINSEYNLDRFRGNSFDGGATTGKFTVQQSSTAPDDFSHSLLVTSSAATADAASNIFNIEQLIEGYNTAHLNFGSSSAKTITLSFYVRSSLTGTFGGALKNSARDRNYPFTYTINSANTFERKEITISGDTSGTWIGSTNGIGLWISFGLGVGSTYSGTAGAWGSGDIFSATGATSVVGTSGATWYITGIQLEVGTATPFEHLSYGEMEQLCQRYFFNSNDGDSANELVSSSMGYAENTTRVDFFVTCPVRMRASPSLTKLQDFIFRESSANKTVTALAFVKSAPQKLWLNGTTSGHTDEASGELYTSGTHVAIQFDAEL